jgi:hypothetical protein
MSFRLSVIVCVIVLRLGSPGSGNAVHYEHVARENPRLHLHITRIDLTDPRVRVGAFASDEDPDGDAGPWQTRLQTVRHVAERKHLDVAVNGNFFMADGAADVGGRRVPYFIGNRARAVGWLVCDGKVISNEPAAASLVVDREGHVSIGKFDALPNGARHVVSGSQLLVSGGNNVARGDVRAPRTAAGIADDGKTLVLLVVDGRLLSHSVGMSEVELADEMIRQGCTEALNLDGGGSSTLVMRDAADEAPQVKNRPSDGHDLRIPLSIERPVACVLGVRVDRDAGAGAATSRSSAR